MCIPDEIPAVVTAAVGLGTVPGNPTGVRISSGELVWDEDMARHRFSSACTGSELPGSESKAHCHRCIVVSAEGKSAHIVRHALAGAWLPWTKRTPCLW